MAFRVSDLVEAMEAIAPVRFASSWDNVGLLVGDEGAALTGVLLAVDCTRAVVEEARRDGRDAIVTYHPPIFDAQKRFVAPSIAYQAASAGIAVYSPHTALDVAEGGTNDVLADVLGMCERAPLRPTDPAAPPLPEPRGDPRLPPAPRAQGIGRVGRVPSGPARALVDRIKRVLAVRHVLVVGSLEREVSRAAVCAGSGGDLLPDAIAAGAQLMLTGELRHHDALRAAAAGLTVVCVLHSVSERAALSILETYLAQRLGGVPVACSRADREPFSFV
jgi:dinuclear metal center YbgI/SA1388 family protein